MKKYYRVTAKFEDGDSIEWLCEGWIDVYELFSTRFKSIDDTLCKITIKEVGERTYKNFVRESKK